MALERARVLGEAQEKFGQPENKIWRPMEEWEAHGQLTREDFGAKLQARDPARGWGLETWCEVAGQRHGAKLQGGVSDQCQC